MIIIPMIVGLLRCVKSNLVKALKELSVEAEYRSVQQKTAVLVSIYISVYIPKFFFFFNPDAKLRALAVLCLVDFPIQFSKHVHILCNLNIIMIMIMMMIIIAWT